MLGSFGRLLEPRDLLHALVEHVCRGSEHGVGRGRSVVEEMVDERSECRDVDAKIVDLFDRGKRHEQQCFPDAAARIVKVLGSETWRGDCSHWGRRTGREAPQ